MERLCFLMELEPGAEAEYERRHDEIWPAMLAALAEAGYTNYTLFRRGTTVVGYAECVPDVATVAARIGAAEVAERWTKSFEGVIASMTDADGNILRADEVWHL